MTYSTPKGPIEDAEETDNHHKPETSEEYKIAYTNDADGAYHVEQDDETEDHFINDKKAL